jgi:hypothetical protein
MSLDIDNIQKEIDAIKHNIWVYGFVDLTEIITSCDFCEAVGKLKDMCEDFSNDDKYRYELKAGMGHLYLKGTRKHGWDKNNYPETRK